MEGNVDKTEFYGKYDILETIDVLTAVLFFPIRVEFLNNNHVYF